MLNYEGVSSDQTTIKAQISDGLTPEAYTYTY